MTIVEIDALNLAQRRLLNQVGIARCIAYCADGDVVDAIRGMLEGLEAVYAQFDAAIPDEATS